MKKILFISFNVPYDTVGHAGGKTHNYYLKKISQNEEYETFLISFCVPSDLEKIDCDKYNIGNKIFCIRPELRYRIFRGFINLSSRFNPWDKYAGIIPEYYVMKIRKQLLEMKESGYSPDIIVLEWTQIVLLVSVIKEIYPDAKYIASEHDVTFLGYKRKYQYEKRLIKKWLAGVRFRTMKKQELEAVELCDYILPHNRKDAAILSNQLITRQKIHPIVPYYMDFSDVKWTGESKNVVFFGAMSRPENYLSAIWFIEKVMPLLEGTGVVFQIIGSRPPKKLKKMESDNVKVLGFVEDVSPYFKDALCMVAPLVIGAGIKVKIIEGMSSGMPVLTNDIGIEGIYAEDEEEYFHCKKPEEYADCINMLLNDRDIAKEVSEGGKKLVKKMFDMDKATDKYFNILGRL